MPLIASGSRALVTGPVHDFRLVAPAALFGACVAHELEYHLGLGDTAGHMLSACPLRGGLLLVCFFATATILLGWRELRVLINTQAELAAAGPPRHGTLDRAVRRGPARLFSLSIAILALQVAIYTLAQHFWPMATLMRMSGHLMRMPIDGALPLLPIQLLVAAILAVAIWRFERRVAALGASIAALIARLHHCPAEHRVLPCPLSTRLCWIQGGLLGFSRPPPALA